MSSTKALSCCGQMIRMMSKGLGWPGESNAKTYNHGTFLSEFPDSVMHAQCSPTQSCRYRKFRLKLTLLGYHECKSEKSIHELSIHAVSYRVSHSVHICSDHELSTVQECLRSCNPCPMIRFPSGYYLGSRSRYALSSQGLFRSLS